MVDYLINVSSDVLASAFVAVSFLSAITLYHLPRRARLRKFFGLRDGASLVVVLSNVWVDASRSVTPVRTGGYKGQASSMGEYRYAAELGQTIERDSGVPRLLQFLVVDDSARRYGRARVTIRLGPRFVDAANPQAHEPVEEFGTLPVFTRRETIDLVAGNATLVLVGSDVYNAAVMYVDEATRGRSDLASQVSFARITTAERPDGVRVVRTPDGDYARGSVTDTHTGRTVYREYAIIKRVYLDSDYGPTAVFLCAGFSTSATVAAVRELTNWAGLAREVEPHEPFAAVFEVLTPHRELIDDTLGDEVKVTRVYLTPRPAKGSRRSRRPRPADPVAAIPAQRAGEAQPTGAEAAH